MGSAAPKLPYDSRLQAMERPAGESVAIPCLAQGFPAPIFRFESFVAFVVIFKVVYTRVHLLRFFMIQSIRLNKMTVHCEIVFKLE